MGIRVAATAAGVTALLLPVLAYTQGPSRTGEGQPAVLMHEVRLLRKAIERQTAAAVRAQILAGRLNIQDQRVSRAAAMADNAERQLSGAETLITRLQQEVAGLRETIDAAADEATREAVEMQLRDLKRRITDAHTASTGLQVRVAETKQALDAERARSDELEASFSRLDRELEPLLR